jgi:hypothetical protein
MAETDLSAWWTVDETAARIGCSKRTVERLGRAKKLEQRLRRQEGTPPVAVYNPDDVARLASERRPAPSPFVLPAVGTGNGHGRPHTAPVEALARPADDAIHRFFTEALRYLHALHQSPPSPPVSETVAETLSPDERAAQYVTVAEAAAIKRLSQAYLRRAIADQRVPAIRDRGWRIRRRDLEGL